MSVFETEETFPFDEQNAYWSTENFDVCQFASCVNDEMPLSVAAQIYDEKPNVNEATIAPGGRFDTIRDKILAVKTIPWVLMPLDLKYLRCNPPSSEGRLVLIKHWLVESKTLSVYFQKKPNPDLYWVLNNACKMAQALATVHQDLNEPFYEINGEHVRVQLESGNMFLNGLFEYELERAAGFSEDGEHSIGRQRTYAPEITKYHEEAYEMEADEAKAAWAAIDHKRADVFDFGLLLADMLMGGKWGWQKLSHYGRTLRAQKNTINLNELPDGHVKDLVGRCCKVNLEDRPTMADVSRILNEIRDEHIENNFSDARSVDV